ncbi:uncharacterized protein LOC131675623 [Phymastichus coffea]|uniref:uncharacterized protein LOC131675623 n=1 Tax=Phymastichus coffea TaxID=108790 RepID=UPI00273CCDBF|nr:uncharacterized protein LOC131675623 [Phymastichus coffea]
MIVAFMEDKHAKWDEHIEEFAFAYNSAIHEATRSSPAFLNYGRHPAPPCTVRREEERAAVLQLEATARDEWRDRMKKLVEVRAGALENSKAAQTRQEKYFNDCHRDVVYNVGDKVWEKNHVLSSAAKAIAAKLCPKFCGPFIVTKRLGMNSYLLQSENGVNIEKVAVNQLKICNDNEQFPHDASSESVDDTEGQHNLAIREKNPEAAGRSATQASTTVATPSPTADLTSQPVSSQAPPAQEAVAPRKRGRPRKSCLNLPPAWPPVILSPRRLRSRHNPSS